MISDDFRPAATGVGVHLSLVTPELVRRGYEVIVITSRRSGEPAIEIWNGVTIYRVFSVKLYGFVQALPSGTTLRRIIEHHRPDVLHYHYVGFMMVRASRIAKAMKMPQVSTYHFSADVLTQKFPLSLLRGFIRFLMLYYNNSFDLVIAPSQNLAAQLKAQGMRTTVQYITNPVVFDDEMDFAPVPRSSAFTVLYAGRLGPEKNVACLIRGFVELLKHFPDSVLWIAGQGPEEGSLRNLTASLEVQQRVCYLGFVDHARLAGYYAACDVFVLPSLMETQGMVAMEAMTFAKPVIVTSAIVSAAELVCNEVSGYIVPPDSPGDIAARLATLASDKDLRLKMGMAGRHRARAFGLEGVVDSLLTAYHHLTTERH